MRYIYLFFSASQTYTARAIRFSTAEAYTHVSLSFDSRLNVMYTFARKQPNFPLPAGFTIENLYQGFYQNNLNIPCALGRIAVSEEIFQKARNEIFQMFENSSRYRYNLLGLVLCQFHIVNERPWHNFCSQFVGNVLTKSGALLLPKHPSLMHPVDFLSLPNTELLYEGNVAELVGILTEEPALLSSIHQQQRIAE